MPATVGGVTLEGSPSIPGTVAVPITPAAPPPPPVQQAPAPPPVQQAAPPPQTPEAGAGPQVLIVPGVVVAAGSPSLGGETPQAPVPTVEAQAAGQGAGGSTTAGASDDLDEALAAAEANDPDLTDLPGWELVDPFGDRTLAAANPPLAHGGALNSIVQHCADYGVDPLAAVANALHEGWQGAIGDQGTAYGPFQIHATDGRLAQFAGRGANDNAVNAWAWSDNGIAYAVRSMVNGKPSAKGLTGHAAVAAIVYGFEKPGDEPGAYKARAAEYDKLHALGSGWAQYAAPLLNGPIAGGGQDTNPITAGPAQTGKVPAEPLSRWQDYTSYLAHSVPQLGSDLVAAGDSIGNLVALPG